MPLQLPLFQDVREEPGIGDPDRRLRSEEVGYLDVVLVERTVGVLCVDGQRTDQLAFTDKGDGERLREALRANQRRIAEGSLPQVEDDVLVRPAVGGSGTIHRDPLPRGVALGEALLRADDEGIARLVPQHQRGCLGRFETSRRAHGGPDAMANVERPRHLRGRVVQPPQPLPTCHLAGRPRHALCHPSLGDPSAKGRGQRGRTISTTSPPTSRATASASSRDGFARKEVCTRRIPPPLRGSSRTT